MIAEKIKPAGQQFSAESFHLYFRKKLLGCDDMLLPNGEVQSIPRSTTDLDVAEFSAYFDQVQAWASERDVWLADIGA